MIEEIKRVWCSCGDSIEPDTDAVCGNCVAQMNTTPQLKELSDEEIIELFEHPDDFNCIDFARAILKKASEK